MTSRDLTPWRSLALKEKLSEGLLTIKGDRNSEKENDEKDKHYHRSNGCESRMAVMSAAWFVEFRQRLPWLLHMD